MLLFDLDDTLYPAGNGLWRAISNRIDSYLTDELGLKPKTARQLRARYARDFGTTLSGLLSEFEIEPAHYLEYVHSIDLANYLQRDERLASLLTQLPGRKAVLTNSSRGHAHRVLDLLGIEGQFERVIAIEDLSLINKPAPQAYRRALELMSYPAPSASMLLDDSLKNLKAAAALGMQTVLVGDRDQDHGYAPDHVIPNLYALPALVAAARIEGRKSDDVRD